MAKKRANKVYLNGFVSQREKEREDDKQMAIVQIAKGEP
jgi:hypothetical protein